ncbi:MAG: aspartate 1-decarboxylase, partial [Microcystis sp.]
QEVLEKGHFAIVLVADAENRCQQFFEQSLIPRSDGQGVEFYSQEC